MTFSYIINITLTMMTIIKIIFTKTGIIRISIISSRVIIINQLIYDSHSLYSSFNYYRYY